MLRVLVQDRNMRLVTITRGRRRTSYYRVSSASWYRVIEYRRLSTGFNVGNGDVAIIII